MGKYQVIVGNIGTVYDGNSHTEASAIYDEYVEQSKSGYGRASGESVTVLVNDEPSREHFGNTEQPDVDDHAIVLAIQELLNGKVWSPDTLDVIAVILRHGGYSIAEPEDPDISF